MIGMHSFLSALKIFISFDLFSHLSSNLCNFRTRASRRTHYRVAKQSQRKVKNQPKKRILSLKPMIDLTAREQSRPSMKLLQSKPSLHLLIWKEKASKRWSKIFNQLDLFPVSAKYHKKYLSCSSFHRRLGTNLAQRFDQAREIFKTREKQRTRN